MPQCRVSLVPLELCFTSEGGLRDCGYTFIPATQLHNPNSQKYSQLKKGPKISFQNSNRNSNLKLGYLVANLTSEETQKNGSNKRKHHDAAINTQQSISGDMERNRQKRAKGKDAHLYQQTGARPKLADISNLKLNEASALSQHAPEVPQRPTRERKPVKNSTRSRNNKSPATDTTEDEENCRTQQYEKSSREKENMDDSKSKQSSTASGIKIHSEERKRTRHNVRHSYEALTECVNAHYSNNTEQVASVTENGLGKTFSSKEIVLDKPLRPKRTRKVVERFEDKSMLERHESSKKCRRGLNEASSTLTQHAYEVPQRPRRERKPVDRFEDTSMLQRNKKAAARRTAVLNALNEQANTLAAQDNEEMPHPKARSKTNARNIKSSNKKENSPMKSEGRESNMFRETAGSEKENLENREVKNHGGRPKRNVKRQVQVVKEGTEKGGEHTEDREVKRKGRHALQCDENSRSVKSKNVRKDEDNPLMSNDEAVEKINSPQTLQKENECMKPKKKTRGRRKINQADDYGKKNDIQNIDEEKTKGKSRKQNNCEESERSKTQTCNANKEAANDQTRKPKNKSKIEEAHPGAIESVEECKITARKGTLKYLHQREKYITALTKEDDGDDDNPFLAKKKKKFKLTALLPLGHEETLVVKTPKRGKNEGLRHTAITPRTAMLGQLQPLTPTSHPYSPIPSLDTNMKNEALHQVYRWMKNKGSKPKKCAGKGPNKGAPSKQKINFTPLELPAVPNDQSGSDTDEADDYFGIETYEEEAGLD